ncbi:uncharacterized protein LOC144167254 isoform X2 [Haemaphysalis longicornis]
MRELVAGTDTGGFAPSIFVVSVILLPWIYLSDEGILPRSQGWLATQKHSTLTSPHYVLHRAYGPTGAVHAAKPTTQHGTGYVVQVQSSWPLQKKGGMKKVDKTSNRLATGSLTRGFTFSLQGKMAAITSHKGSHIKFLEG